MAQPAERTDRPKPIRPKGKCLKLSDEVTDPSVFKGISLYKTDDASREYTDEEISLFLNYELNRMMTPAQADFYISKAANTVMSAIRRKEIRPLRCPGSEQCYVTPLMLGRWILTYWQQ